MFSMTKKTYLKSASNNIIKRETEAFTLKSCTRQDYPSVFNFVMVVLPNATRIREEGE